MDDFDAEKRLGIVAYGRKTKDTLRKEKKAREEHEERRRARKEQTKRERGAANREKKADVLAAIRRRVEELIAGGTSAAELATPTREIALMDEELCVAVPAAEPAPACGKTKREKRREKEEREMDSVTVATADGPATLPVVRLHGKDAALDDLVDRYYGMDFEDVVGGQAMRFEYVECPPDDRG